MILSDILVDFGDQIWDRYKNVPNAKRRFSRDFGVPETGISEAQNWQSKVKRRFLMILKIQKFAEQLAKVPRGSPRFEC